MAKTGRKLTLDKRRSKHILRAISHGLSYKRAAQAAGVVYSTFHRWMRKGCRDRKAKIKSDYRKFYEDVMSAEARAEDAQAEMIHRTAKKVWTAAAWWLERRHPERWGRRDAVVPVKMVEGLPTGSKTMLPSPEEILQRLVEVIGRDAALAIIARAAEGVEQQKITVVNNGSLNGHKKNGEGHADSDQNGNQ